MFNREILIRPPEPFAIPVYGGYGSRNHYPSEDVLNGFLSNLERIMIGLGVEFPVELPIAAGLTGPIDDMTDIYLTLSYMPHDYPTEKIRSSDIFVGSCVTREINSMNLSSYGSPWAHGDYKGRDDEYETRYWVTNTYILYLQSVVNQLDENGLLIRCPPAFRYVFLEAS